MRNTRFLLLVPLLVLMLAGGAYARGYGKSGQPMAPGAMGGGSARMEQFQGNIVPGQPNRFVSENSVVYTGRLTGVDWQNNELLVRTQVPGLLGPQTADVPFRVEHDSTLTVCFKSLNTCNSQAIGTDGVELLKGLESFPAIASAPKSVIIVGDPDTNRIIHVEVTYGI